MTRRKIVAKTNKKDDLDPTKDQFVTKTMSVMDWAYERRRLIILLASLAVVISAASILFSRYQESQINERSSLLGRGLTAAIAPVVPPAEGDAPAPPPAEDQTTFETANARATQALGDYKKAASQLGDSDLGLMAVLGSASAHFDLKDYDKAVEAYTKFVNANRATLAWLRPTAIEGLAYALEAKGNADKAKAELEKLLANEQGAPAQMARFQLARLAQAAGDKAKAIEHLKTVMEAYKEDSKYDQYDYLFVQARERFLGLDPKADVPPEPGMGLNGLNNMNPELLRQLMQSQAGG